MQKRNDNNNRLKSQPVLVWAIISVIFAIIIHFLFSISSPIEFFVAKWSAGELLAYASTVALGLLAIWQNKRFKDENDISQERLEKLTEQANTLTSINKIIEIEQNNLSNLRAALDAFSSACDPIEIALNSVNAFSNESSLLSIMSATAMQDKRVFDSYIALARELRIDPQIKINQKDPFLKAMNAYYVAAKEIITELKNDPSKNVNSKIDSLIETKKLFISEREKLLIRKENMLTEAIYGKKSLDEIKIMFHEDYMAQEEDENG